MAKKKHSQLKQSFNQMVAEIKKPKDIKEDITISSDEIENQITTIQNYNEQNLALSFKSQNRLLTSVMLVFFLIASYTARFFVAPANPNLCAT